ncbi:N-acetyldiaminopimelate deacetylase [subsurface metagenome]
MIPSEVKIAGTFRTFDENWRKAAFREMKKIIAEFERKESIGVKFNIKKGYPVLRNDLKITKSAIRLSGAFLGEKNVVSLEQRMTSEDFANYSHSCPVCFFRLGTGIKGKEYALHTSDFNIDENALATGMGNLSWLACSLLKEMSE